MNNGMEQQVENIRQQAVQAGISGSALVDIQPSRGIIRVKVNMPSKEQVRPFTQNYGQVICASLQGLNLSVKRHIAEEAHDEQ